MLANMHQAKTHLSRLVDKALHGEEILIARDGKPLVKLVPMEKSPLPARKFGTLKGKIWMSPDCWDDDLELRREMEEGPIFPEKQ